MGIRVHKQIGYGVADVKWKKKGKYGWQLNDPRFDLEKYETLWDREKEWNLKAPEFIEWIDGHKKEIADVAGIDLVVRDRKDSEALLSNFYLLQSWINEKKDHPIYKKICKRTISETYTFDYEYAKKEVFHMMPLSSYDWRRYDNIIDYCEEGRFHKSKNRYKFLGWGGIYPYLSHMTRFKGETPSEVDKLNGWYSEKIKEGILEPANYSMLVGDWDKRESIAKGEVLKDLKENWRSRIPLEIHAQLLLLGFIKDVKSFVNEMRPMLYVHWG